MITINLQNAFALLRQGRLDESESRERSAAAVEFVYSAAGFLSTSHRSMERAGMKLLFLRATWTPLA